MMKNFSLVDVIEMVVAGEDKHAGMLDVKKLAYYIEAYAELDCVDNPLVLLKEVTEQAEEKTVNALMFEVFEGIIESLCIEYGADSFDFTVYIDGCASSLDYVGNDNMVYNIVYSL